MNQLTEIELIEKYQTGCSQEQKKASNALWIKYKSWIGAIVGQWRKRKTSSNETEMISEACVAFFGAVKAYDVTRADTTSLRTFSSIWINGALSLYAKSQIHRDFIVPRCTSLLRYRLFELLGERNTLSTKDVNLIAQEFDFSARQVRAFETFFCHSNQVNFELWESASEAKDLYFGKKRDNQKISSQVRKFVESQKFPLSKILNERWLSENKTTYASLASELNRSGENIRQLEKRAFSGLVSELKSQAMIY